MTTPEQRLREILLAEAEDLVPAGDGLQRIEQRLYARRSMRRKLVPALTMAGVAVVAAAIALSFSFGDDTALEQPVQPGPSPTATVTTSASGIPLWPVTTDAEATEWKALPAHAWGSDPVQVTQHLLDDYLKLPGRATTQVGDDPAAPVVEVSNGTRPVAQVRLVRVGRGNGGPWAVTGAVSDNLSVTQPEDGALVSTPIHVTGRASDPDTSVHLRLMSDRVLGEGYAMAGRDVPWTHSLAWSPSDWSVAALVTNTFNGKGDLSAITITAVRRAQEFGGPVAADTYVATQNGGVFAVETATGQPRRQVSYPPAGAIDSDPDRGGSDVVWVRTKGDGCSSALIRAGLGGGPASTPVAFAPVRRRLPALSAHGTSLAWVEQPCSGGATSVVVRGADQRDTTVEVSSPVLELDVRDDGATLVLLADRLVSLPPRARTLAAGTDLRVDAGCVVQGPVWGHDTAIGWERCGDAWQSVQWLPDGTGQAANVVDIRADIAHTAEVDGAVLVSLVDGRIVRIAAGHAFELPNANRWSSPDW